jgi:hypothetical protein
MAHIRDKESAGHIRIYPKVGSRQPQIRINTHLTRTCYGVGEPPGYSLCKRSAIFRYLLELSRFTNTE